MLKLFVVVAALSALGIQAPQGPTHGPYYGQNVVCYRGPTDLAAKPKGMVHCECKAPCDHDNIEDKACQTYCGRGEQCVCHADECDGTH